MQRTTLRTFIVVALCSLLGLKAVADTTPEDAADYRSSVMTAMRGHVGAASMITRGLVEDDGHLLAHAEALALTANELDRLFPAGSNVGDSEALPVIWEEPEAFAEAVGKLQDAADAFLEAVENGEPEGIGAAFRNVGTSCRGCHDRYRAERD